MRFKRIIIYTALGLWAAFFIVIARFHFGRPGVFVSAIGSGLILAGLTGRYFYRKNQERQRIRERPRPVYIKASDRVKIENQYKKCIAEIKKAAEALPFRIPGNVEALVDTLHWINLHIIQIFDLLDTGSKKGAAK
jgi:hypothetical protein